MTARDVYRALWRHKFFIVVLTAALVGATWYVTSRQTRTYEASTLVRVRESASSAGNASTALLAATTLAQTYSKIIGSGALSGEIETLAAICSSGNPSSTNSGRSAAPVKPSGPGTSRNVGSPSATSCAWLRGTSRTAIAPRKISQVKVSGSPVEDLDLLSITAQSRNPTNAMLAANAVPPALRSFIRKSGSLSEQLITVKPATIPSSPVSRQWPLKIAIALLLGLVFNGALALLIELFRDRFPEPDELEQALGHPVLATIPTLRLHSVPSAAVPNQPGPASAGERSLVGEGIPQATESRRPET